MVNATYRPLYPRNRDPVPNVQEAGWAPGLVWTGAGNLTPIEIPSAERPALNASPYRLSYRGPQISVLSEPNFIGLQRDAVRLDAVWVCSSAESP